MTPSSLVGLLGFHRFMSTNNNFFSVAGAITAAATALQASAPAGPTDSRRGAWAANERTFCSGGRTNRVSSVPRPPITDGAGRQAPRPPLPDGAGHQASRPPTMPGSRADGHPSPGVARTPSEMGPRNDPRPQSGRASSDAATPRPIPPDGAGPQVSRPNALPRSRDAGDPSPGAPSTTSEMGARDDDEHYRRPAHAPPPPPRAAASPHFLPDPRGSDATHPSPRPDERVQSSLSTRGEDDHGGENPTSHAGYGGGFNSHSPHPAPTQQSGRTARGGEKERTGPLHEPTYMGGSESYCRWVAAQHDLPTLRHSQNFWIETGEELNRRIDFEDARLPSVKIGIADECRGDVALARSRIAQVETDLLRLRADYTEIARRILLVTRGILRLEDARAADEAMAAAEARQASAAPRIATDARAAAEARQAAAAARAAADARAAAAARAAAEAEADAEAAAAADAHRAAIEAEAAACVRQLAATAKAADDARAVASARAAALAAARTAGEAGAVEARAATTATAADDARAVPSARAAALAAARTAGEAGVAPLPPDPRGSDATHPSPRPDERVQSSLSTRREDDHGGENPTYHAGYGGGINSHSPHPVPTQQSGRTAQVREWYCRLAAEQHDLLARARENWFEGAPESYCRLAAEQHDLLALRHSEMPWLAEAHRSQAANARAAADARRAAAEAEAAADARRAAIEAEAAADARRAADAVRATDDARAVDAARAAAPTKAADDARAVANARAAALAAARTAGEAGAAEARAAIAAGLSNARQQQSGRTARGGEKERTGPLHEPTYMGGSESYCRWVAAQHDLPTLRHSQNFWIETGEELNRRIDFEDARLPSVKIGIADECRGDVALARSRIAQVETDLLRLRADYTEIARRILLVTRGILRLEDARAADEAMAAAEARQASAAPRIATDARAAAEARQAAAAARAAADARAAAAARAAAEAEADAEAAAAADAHRAAIEAEAAACVRQLAATAKAADDARAVASARAAALAAARTAGEAGAVEARAATTATAADDARAVPSARAAALAAARTAGEAGAAEARAAIAAGLSNARNTFMRWAHGQDRGPANNAATAAPAKAVHDRPATISDASKPLGAGHNTTIRVGGYKFNFYSALVRIQALLRGAYVRAGHQRSALVRIQALLRGAYVRAGHQRRLAAAATITAWLSRRVAHHRFRHRLATLRRRYYDEARGLVEAAYPPPRVAAAPKTYRDAVVAASPGPSSTPPVAVAVADAAYANRRPSRNTRRTNARRRGDGMSTSPSPHQHRTPLPTANALPTPTRFGTVASGTHLPAAIPPAEDGNTGPTAAVLCTNPSTTWRHSSQRSQPFWGG
eukprot:CAMPEP_0172572696 /NCGR_PEP_ID=MMETSP1067-20121228/135798_1 /TAXON_ID=265564 ORGANISM="Thalassiosira punctigera, Strain Tpunct2005C2" /NCGR_SAMPLE_ID=MMETSP1067 /ASSEMBLY_ACC=CAM_ASM_000444 /LENGTH=1345 /DNA_ID=CAMNT_0013365279 /DNA_START=200 /DNA_END=4238 /DNA_ORIENTATION=-